MLELLTRPIVAAFVAPLIASALTIFVKWSSRNDRHARFTKEDCAIGLELSVTGIFALVASLPALAASTGLSSEDEAGAQLAEIVALTMLMVFAFTIGLWIISTIVRKVGWVDDQTLRWIPGLVVPLIYGFIVLLTATLWISSII